MAKLTLILAALGALAVTTSAPPADSVDKAVIIDAKEAVAAVPVEPLERRDDLESRAITILAFSSFSGDHCQDNSGHATRVIFASNECFSFGPDEKTLKFFFQLGKCRRMWTDLLPTTRDYRVTNLWCIPSIYGQSLQRWSKVYRAAEYLLCGCTGLQVICSCLSMIGISLTASESDESRYGGFRFAHFRRLANLNMMGSMRGIGQKIAYTP